MAEQYVRNHIIPDDNSAVNIGAPAAKFSDVYADFFHGTVVGGSVTLTIPGTSMAVGANNPTLEVLRDGLELYAFIGTGNKIRQGFFTTHLVLAPGTGVQPDLRLHWAHNTLAPTGNVRWAVDVSYAAVGGTYGTPSSFVQTQAAGAQYEHLETSAMLLPAGMTAGTALLIRVKRDQSDVADTFANYAHLTHLTITYTT